MTNVALYRCAAANEPTTARVCVQEPDEPTRHWLDRVVLEVDEHHHRHHAGCCAPLEEMTVFEGYDA